MRVSDQEIRFIALTLVGETLINYEYSDWDELPELVEEDWTQVHDEILAAGRAWLAEADAFAAKHQIDKRELHRRIAP